MGLREKVSTNRKVADNRKTVSKLSKPIKPSKTSSSQNQLPSGYPEVQGLQDVCHNHSRSAPKTVGGHGKRGFRTKGLEEEQLHSTVIGKESFWR